MSFGVGWKGVQVSPKARTSFVQIKLTPLTSNLQPPISNFQPPPPSFPVSPPPPSFPVSPPPPSQPSPLQPPSHASHHNPHDHPKFRIEYMSKHQLISSLSMSHPSSSACCVSHSLAS
ncbi:hypothetical protein SCHPADRAFT_909082 [Schizopora paradoxa]|uniref:Uncharacterized protein n=1 Tax=Schizopora paradoxa TaxID=27342 RepID=A0A0H2RSN9_9AGAM|nr:hypothetical protein SCHPADRAFT_909082 [Schizopora paradoxa]